LTNRINEGQKARAVSPINEIYTLFNNFVNPVKWVLLGITALICVVSGVSILVSIYNSMNDRKHEIAVMRALGAGRRKILAIVLAESVLLSLLGGLLGWVVGHLLIGGVAGPMIENRTGVTIGIFDLAPRVNPFEILGESPIMDWKGISSELLLIPALILLAIAVGFLPALTAYRTDVAKALSANP
ncbi:MAG: ABC transporter permease, partial [Planctomycetota bacterium]